MVKLFFYRIIEKVQNRAVVRLLRRIFANKSKQFKCPVCGYTGVFLTLYAITGPRRWAQCSSCGALERHRLQMLVLRELEMKYDFSEMKMLHFAPEYFLTKYFKDKVKSYETADLLMAGVDHQVDMTDLPFDDDTYNFVFASHVLEHIKDDVKALKEIARILKPGGIAILHVPIVSYKTIEYQEPNPYEAYHVRAPGLDYIEKYKQYFKSVTEFNSYEFDECYQVIVHENRSNFPNKYAPLRPSMLGDKFDDIVTFCINL